MFQINVCFIFLFLGSNYTLNLLLDMNKTTEFLFGLMIIYFKCKTGEFFAIMYVLVLSKVRMQMSCVPMLHLVKKKHFVDF